MQESEELKIPAEVTEVTLPDGTSLPVLPVDVPAPAPRDKAAPVSVGSVALPDEGIYERLFDQEAMRVAYKTYMSREDAGLEDAADVAGVPLNTVLRWAYGGKWLETKGKILAVRVQDENQRLARLRATRRRKEIEMQVDTGSKLREKIDDTLADDERTFTPGELKMLGDAAKAAGDLTVRALGVGESGATVEEAQGESGGKDGKKQPLVFIFPHGGLPPVRIPDAKQAEVINP